MACSNMRFDSPLRILDLVGQKSTHSMDLGAPGTLPGTLWNVDPPETIRKVLKARITNLRRGYEEAHYLCRVVNLKLAIYRLIKNG